jgi:hypothetical protein
MNLAIEVRKLEDSSGHYIASVDWTKCDYGQIGTPGMIRYADTEKGAYEALKVGLEAKGHTIIS